jgi:hypothetical protein
MKKSLTQKTKSRSNQPRVSKKTAAKKMEGARAATAANKKTSVGQKIKSAGSQLKNEVMLGTKTTNLAKNKNVSPAYLAGYKAGLRKMGKTTDANLARYKEEKRVQGKKK